MPATAQIVSSPTLVRARIPELDGIRGLAILLVLIWHYVVCILWTTPGSFLHYLLVALRLTWSGVDLFFVLSGFLIGGILLDARQSPTYFRTFYVRRFCRIIPIYFGWIILLAIGLRVTHFGAPWQTLFNHRIPFWAYPVFLQNFFMAARQTFGSEWIGITWSLAVEEQFYLVLPLLVRVVSTRNLVIGCVGAFACAPIVRVAFFLHANSFFAPYSLLPCRADALAVGVLIAIAARNGQWRGILIRHRVWIRLTFAILGLGLFELVLHPTGRLMVTVGYSWLALFYGTLLIIVTTFPTKVERTVFGRAFLPNLGIIAYGLYLYHQGINSLMHGMIFGTEPRIDGPQRALATAASMVITLLLARCSWTFVESQLVRWAQHKFKYQITSPPPMS